MIEKTEPITITVEFKGKFEIIESDLHRAAAIKDAMYEWCKAEYEINKASEDGNIFGVEDISILVNGEKIKFVSGTEFEEEEIC